MSLKPSSGKSAELEWMTSSHSTPDGPDCVEVAPHALRRSRPRLQEPHRPRLTLTSAAWVAFLPYAAGR